MDHLVVLAGGSLRVPKTEISDVKPLLTVGGEACSRLAGLSAH